MSSHFEDWIVTVGNRVSNIKYDLIETVGQESRYSSLLPHHIKDTVRFFRTEIPCATSILDGTAHIGTDSLNFLNMYPNVKLTAVELNPDTIQILTRNMKNASTILGKEVQSPNIVEGSVIDYLGAYQGPKFSFIYLDPPWGGPDYKKQSKIELMLDEHHLHDIVPWILCRNITENVVIKLPKNADIVSIINTIGNHNYKLYTISNSYLLLFIK